MTDKEKLDHKWCYECSRFRDISVMQKYDCVKCGGRKCFIHGGENVHKCNFCDVTNLCSDCVSFSKCCHVFKDGEFVGDISNLDE